MFFLRRPAKEDVARFLTASAPLSLSYSPDTMAGHRRYAIDETAGMIGQGNRDFACACDALRHWEQFRFGWVEVLPDDAPIDRGTTVAVCIRHLGFWSLNGARVVLVEETPGRRFAISYGTLANHAERGEELFEVSLDPRTGAVMYRIRAFSQPRSWLARLGGPIVRRLQAKARAASLQAMRRAVARRSIERRC
jgi:uncharacterized protein (UPF0548 family)